MWLKIILLTAFCAGAVWVGLINACPAHFVDCQGTRVLRDSMLGGRSDAARRAARQIAQGARSLG